MKEEVMKILGMLEQGTITAAQAAQLMEAMDIAGGAGGAGTPDETVTLRKSKRKLRIVVTSPKGENVNIKIPAKLITAGVKIGKYFSKHTDGSNDAMQDIDWEELNSAVQQMIDENAEGEIIDVQSEKGDNIKIWLE